MKKIIISGLAMLFSVFAWSEYTMIVHRSGGKLSFSDCESVDSVKCVGANLKLFEQGEDVSEIPFRQLDSLTFVDADVLVPRDTVFVVFSEGAVRCLNPYESSVEIKTDGACVNVNSLAYQKDIVYHLSGSSTNGYFAIDSERKFTVIMNDLTLTSNKELPPVRSFSGKTMTVKLQGKNTLTDSANDTANAVIRSKGQIVFEESTGSLVVNAKQKRGIQTGDYIEVKGGDITVNSDLDDCVRVKDYFWLSGGKFAINGGGLNVTNGYFRLGNGSFTATSNMDKVKIIEIESELLDEDEMVVTDAEHGAFWMTSGVLTIESSAKGARGIKADGDVNVYGGKINCVLSGTSVYDAEDGSTNTTAIKANGYVKFMSGVHTFSTTSTAVGSRLITGDMGVTFDNGVSVDLSNASSSFFYVSNSGEDKTKVCSMVKSDKNIVFNNCSVHLRAEAASDGAYGLITDADMEVNDNAVVVIETASADGVYVDSEANGKLICKGGYISSFSGKARAFSCPISSAGGTCVGVGKYRHNGGFAGSSYQSALDLEYDMTPFQVTDAAGTVLFSHNGKFMDGYTAGKLSISYPFQNGSSYKFKVGGTLTGDVIGTSGFVNNGVYSGGEVFDFDSHSRPTISMSIR